MFTVYTFGDSILDCGHYNDRGVTPAQLLARNEDRLFPEFRGQDLTKRFGSVRLEHRAVDGSMVDDLPQQARRLNVPDLETHAALLTIGGNDLLAGLLADPGPGIDDFAIDPACLPPETSRSAPSSSANVLRPDVRRRRPEHHRGRPGAGPAQLQEAQRPPRRPRRQGRGPRRPPRPFSQGPPRLADPDDRAEPDRRVGDPPLLLEDAQRGVSVGSELTRLLRLGPRKATLADT